MPNRLPVPEELLHLIEKRESGDRRSEEERRKADFGPIGAIESLTDLTELPLEERRGRTDRRAGKDRRCES
jgi:hypothetical protein